MNITQLNSSAIKAMSLGKKILPLGRFHPFFAQRHSVRIGWNNSISYETRTLKGEKNSELYTALMDLDINLNLKYLRMKNNNIPLRQIGLNLDPF